MSNIQRLRREGLAARALWHFGADTLPLRQDDPTSLQADALREVENVCPFHDPQCVDMCMRPQVCGGEPDAAV